MKKEFIDIAYELARKAYDRDEVPVGCVIVLDDVIIGTGYNNKEHTNDVTNHAEIIAIREASKKIGDWRLDGSILYTTVEPCQMCMGAIRESRISKVVFCVNSSSIKSYYKDILLEQVDAKKNESLLLLKSFFEGKRK
jgi:tRNA(Arg) A34 adenosine deaminase TadA